ncbi:MAG: YtxH domain-containing protein [Chloroflexi bacterium]|nr:YtxH domain-containing protein [Chloroflexota bacterium]MCI0578255.1 YtxH domain-containing protein [Chloroflexota bacterium]MCI0643500.1 YtxH domain-containing protein [Chloroflexota bacterium]MCI0726608.1 YtxH domain-containing protein [Chloroflexota bacterium]
MSENNSSDIGAFLAGFVIGGLVGAATALILAPQSGEETRAQITAKGQEIRRIGEERVNEYREMAGQAVDDARSRVQDTTSQVQERARIVLDEGKSKVNEAIEKGKDRVAQIKGDVSDETTPAA